MLESCGRVSVNVFAAATAAHCTKDNCPIYIARSRACSTISPVYVCERFFSLPFYETEKKCAAHSVSVYEL